MTIIDHRLSAYAAPLTALRALLVGVVRTLRARALIARTEHELARLSRRQLADIGLDGPRLPESYRRMLLNRAWAR